MNLLGIGFATSVVSERVRFDRQRGRCFAGTESHQFRVATERRAVRAGQ